ncbi:amino acid transporter, partial [Klebsiella pneumoniae]|nr:amino acid transporter [Klebsiella pneumoniae]
VVSAVVDDLSLVLGLVGSFGSTAISFILPALLYMTLFPEESAHRRAAFALGVWGAVVMVLTVSVTLVRLFW